MAGPGFGQLKPRAREHLLQRGLLFRHQVGLVPFRSAGGGALGISGETPPYNMADTVEAWFSGAASDCPGGSDCAYQQMIYSDIISGWQNAGYANNGANPPCWYVASYYFNSAIPTAASAGTVPHE